MIRKSETGRKKEEVAQIYYHPLRCSSAHQNTGPISAFFTPRLITGRYICLVLQFPIRAFQGRTYCGCPPTFPAPVIALLGFIAASVNVTAQSADWPFMNTAPKQRFVFVCPCYHFIVRTCEQFPPPTASKGVLKIKDCHCAERNPISGSAGQW